ncbi:unnamed protein product [Brassica napus]|uniref:(rape) hypothetical protein n=1 Tax=Brassica napus TaxID=3708 RepID=A0A816T538_BRANA|nr:unnamed protein product [Brassica napus]
MYILNIKEAMHGLFSYAVESIHALGYRFCDIERRRKVEVDGELRTLLDLSSEVSLASLQRRWKKLWRTVQNRFSLLTDELLDVILPPKVEITVSKFQNRVLVYSIEGGCPMFFDIDGRGNNILPTFFALWEAPEILPSFMLKGVVRTIMSSNFTVFSSEPDIFSMFDSPVCPVEVNPGLEKTNSCPIQTRNDPNPGLEDTHLPDKDERRKKRKKSNRESARRSRIKKQKHLEEVRSQLNQLNTENRDLVNRLRYFMHHCQHAKMESDRLRLEHKVLLDKLLNLRQALVLRQVQQSSTCACVESTVVTYGLSSESVNDMRSRQLSFAEKTILRRHRPSGNNYYCTTSL